MNRYLILVGIALVLAGSGDLGAAEDTELPPALSEPVAYERDVEPILHKNCYLCHGPSQQMNGLRLDRRADVLKGGHSGKAVLPGDSARSALIHRVASDKEGFKMPPAGTPLSTREIATLRAWIDQGMEWPEDAVTEKKDRSKAKSLWSFQPIKHPAEPQVSNTAWVRNPIDAFVLAKLEAEGIEPSAAADKITLLRRVSFDLTGLPPTPDDVTTFLEDDTPAAYERLVDRLLNSPHYGEKWARHWLDLARYADSDGYEKDLDRPYAWRWRHWVIDALNRDMPFDEFTIAQIAGDLLPDASVEQRVATGFHRNALKNREAGVKRAEARFEEVIDRTNTVGTVWLGLTVGCAQCHDHKYDPLSQQEYYQLFSFFNSADEAEIAAPLAGEMGPYLRALPAYRKQREALLDEFEIALLQVKWEEKIRRAMDHPGENTAWDFQITAMRATLDSADRRLKTPIERRTQYQKDIVTDYFVRRYGPELAKDDCAVDAFKELQRKLGEIKKPVPFLTRAYALTPYPEPVTTHVAIRGDWRRPGIPVKSATPTFLPALPTGDDPPRLLLARWLVDESNPLTARVTANRVWQEFFGRGLVRTSDDFGTQGEPPTHPELLDWLASEFVTQDWSLKRLHKTIVLSSTYRQRSDARPDVSERDSDNSLFARQARLRLSAELVRDAALAAGGLLYPKIGGKSIRPVQPEGVSKVTYGSSTWQASEGRERYRRGLYVHYKRTSPYPMLANFDQPNSTVSATQRRRSNTPLQALNLLNDPVFFEAAQALAFRVLRESKPTWNDRLNYAYRLCVARDPDSNERDRLATYFEQQKTIFEQDRKAVELATPGGISNIDPVKLAAWVSVARSLMNLDEFITRE